MAQRNGFEDYDDGIYFAFNHDENNFDHSQNLDVPTYDDDEVNAVYEELAGESFQGTLNGNQVGLNEKVPIGQEFQQYQELDNQSYIGQKRIPLKSNEKTRVDYRELQLPNSNQADQMMHNSEYLKYQRTRPQTQKIRRVQPVNPQPLKQQNLQGQNTGPMFFTQRATPQNYINKIMLPVKTRPAYTQNEVDFLNHANLQRKNLQIQRLVSTHSSPLNRTVVASPNWENQPGNHQVHQQRTTHPPHRKAEKLTRWGRKSQEDKDRLNRKRTENRREQRKRDIQKAREERENQVNGNGSSDKKKDLLQKINFLNSLL